MIFSVLSIAAMAAVAIYLVRWVTAQRRRNAQSWESIVARLRPDWDAAEAGAQSFWNDNAGISLEEKWRRIRGAHGLWVMYENTRVMLEMADYALRNSASVDRELIAALRSDALQIRVFVVSALARYAFSHVNESICSNAARATAMYADMTARMAELLQGQQMAPSYVAAM